jgi:hypothetical protein
MFGWINDCTECLVLTKFGTETWHQIKEKAGCQVEDGGFLRYKCYPDSDTVTLVVAASEVLGMSVDDVLYAFGDYFIVYVQENGYSNVLECLGSNLRDWLANLNFLHDHLQGAYPKGFVAPIFWSEDDYDEEGRANNAILVHYHSRRGSLLVPLVVGCIKKIALVYFDIEINMEQLQLQDETQGIENTTWRITAVDPAMAFKLRGKRAKRGIHHTPEGVHEITDDEKTTVSTYERTFREGGAQAANLRVEEFVKRSFYNENSELFHALTLEQYEYLVSYWKFTQVDGKWCYEIWSIQDDDPKSWAALKDLPEKLNPATIDPSTFGGKKPTTGEYPPLEDGSLQSFPPKIRIVNATSGKSEDFIVAVESDLSLEDAIYNHPAVDEAGIKEFTPSLEEEFQRKESEIQCVVWNDESNEAYHTFALADLKTTSTKQLYDLVPKSFDPIKIVVQSTKVHRVDDDEEDI